MERIQEAIEKARRERQGKIGGAADKSDVSDSADGGDDANLESRPMSGREPSVESETSTSAEPASTSDATSLPNSQEGAHSIRITYSDTRRVELDEDELKDRHIVAGFAHDSRSEPYRQLRSQVLNKFRENNWQTLAITSPATSSGSTLTAINLAISLSLEANQTVLLVDLNLRNPGVASTFGLGHVQAGVVDYLNGASDLKEILINPGYERLVVLPATKHGAFTSEVLSSPEMQTVVQELVSRYPSRLIIFVLPAVMDHDDALVFAPKCDATLMVLEEGGSKKADIERAYQLLEGANVIGSVLNKVRYP